MFIVTIKYTNLGSREAWQTLVINPTDKRIELAKRKIRRKLAADGRQYKVEVTKWPRHPSRYVR